MLRLTLLILLLTVVYSWEECKFVVVAIWSKLTRRNKIYQKNSDLDTLVSDLILIATIPLNLAYLILGQDDLARKLLIILVELLFLSLILKGLQEYARRRKFTEDYQGSDKVVAIVFSLLGLVSPGARFASSVTRGTKVSKYLWALILPIICGLGLALLVHSQGFPELQDKMDILIAIATLGLILNATIEIMEHMFRTNNWKIMSLMRVALGVLIILFLTGQ